MNDTFRPIHPADMPHRIAALEARVDTLEEILDEIDELCVGAIEADNTNYWIKQMGRNIREIIADKVK